jgi:hypothetical protein
MPKNAILYRDYTDDGCSLFECLLCHETWEDRRDRGWRFCSFCGTEWEEEVRQEYVELPYRKRPDGDPTKGHAIIIEWQAHCIFEDKLVWHYLESYHSTQCDLVELLPQLRQAIKDDDLRVFQPPCDYFDVSALERIHNTRIRIVKMDNLPEGVRAEPDYHGRVAIRSKY